MKTTKVNISNRRKIKPNITALELMQVKHRVFYAEHINGDWFKVECDRNNNIIHKENSWSGVELDKRNENNKPHNFK